MSNEVTVAIIGLIGLLLGAWLEWTRRDVGKVRHEVTANGGTSAHDDLRADIRGVRSTIDHVANDVRGIREDIGGLHQTDRDLRAELRRAATDRGEEIRSAIDRHEQTHHRGETP